MVVARSGSGPPTRFVAALLAVAVVVIVVSSFLGREAYQTTPQDQRGGPGTPSRVDQQGGSILTPTSASQQSAAQSSAVPPTTTTTSQPTGTPPAARPARASPFFTSLYVIAVVTTVAGLFVAAFALYVNLSERWRHRTWLEDNRARLLAIEGPLQEGALPRSEVLRVLEDVTGDLSLSGVRVDVLANDPSLLRLVGALLAALNRTQPTEPRPGS